MSKRKSVTKPVYLTERTLQDLLSIEEYSISSWGRRVAHRYLGDIEAALLRISEHPEILREELNFHKFLFFHRVNQHLLVCDLQPDAIFVVTVLHANMDIPERFTKLEPTLKFEVELLHQQLSITKKKSR